ncbi:MAG: rhamnogalacturonan acetylesterase [Lachnospiraceae bacterium]|nr:rhamnogalacturonan acetylesterase [Lachnospiraceae bacterium]
MRMIFWAGDSTSAANSCLTYPQTGIAQMFDRYAQRDVLVYNHAVNGRSTKSFLDEGRLDEIDASLAAGDFLFVQFGHNDEKRQDPSRYTDPSGAYTDNLLRFADTARAHKAYPVFITPVERRVFDEQGRLQETGHAPYAEAMLAAGERFKVPVIDLFHLSRAWLASVGDEASKPFYMITKPGEFRGAPEGQIDNSHLKVAGAMLYAGMIAKELYRLGGVYAALVNPAFLEESEGSEGAAPEKVTIEING